MRKIFNVLIIGAGKIGAFFDAPSSENILTHAHAFSKLREFNLLGFVDSDKDIAQKAANIWHTQAFKNIEDAFYNNSVEIVCICVPDKYHYEILKKIANFPVKIIFAEKPLVKTLGEAEDIMKLYKELNIKCLVNYSRRFVPEFESIKSNFVAGEYGKVICGNGYYGKGTLHNGSHLIDFLRYMFGEVKDTKTFSYDYDFYNDDPSVSAVLRFENGVIFTMMNVPCDKYTIFELDLLFEKKRIKILDSGFKLEMYEVCNSEVFEGYKNLIKHEEYNTILGNSMENAALNIYNYLNNEEELKCTLEDGYMAMKICEKLKEGIKNE